MDKAIVFPVDVSDQNWQQFCDQPTDYVDQELQSAIENDEREVFVRRAFDIRRQRPMPTVKNLVWHVFLGHISDGTVRKITPEEQEVARLWWMRRSLNESCGFPPLRKKLISRLRRAPAILR